MTDYSARIYQRLLIGGFLLVILGVPTSQVFVELYRGTPVRYTELFLDAPTRANLRRYEKTLEQSWWGQTWLRPVVERWLFATLGRTNRKTLTGRGGWLFYRPGVEYLIVREKRVGNDTASLWVPPTPPPTARQGVIQAIVQFRDQLRQRECQLLVVPVPGKASIYPDRLTRRAEQKWQSLRSPIEDLLADLAQHGIHSVNLFQAFRHVRARLERTQTTGTLYLARDTHWTPLGARVAAEAVAAELHRLGWTSGPPYKYSVRTVRVARNGDLVALLGLGQVARSWPGEPVQCRQIIDPFLQRPPLPGPNDRAGIYMNQHLIDTPMESRILILGDSYCRIYQLPEPASLGTVCDQSDQPNKTRPASGTKRPLPGAAGFPALLAAQLRAPVDFIVSDGGAATRVRQTLSVTPEILQNKQVVVWEFTERDIRLGTPGWQPVRILTASQ